MEDINIALLIICITLLLSFVLIKMNTEEFEYVDSNNTHIFKTPIRLYPKTERIHKNGYVNIENSLSSIDFHKKMSNITTPSVMTQPDNEVDYSDISKQHIYRNNSLKNKFSRGSNSATGSSRYQLSSVERHNLSII